MVCLGSVPCVVMFVDVCCVVVACGIRKKRAARVSPEVRKFTADRRALCCVLLDGTMAFAAAFLPTAAAPSRDEL